MNKNHVTAIVVVILVVGIAIYKKISSYDRNMRDMNRDLMSKIIEAENENQRIRSQMIAKERAREERERNEKVDGKSNTETFGEKVMRANFIDYDKRKKGKKLIKVKDQLFYLCSKKIIAKNMFRPVVRINKDGSVDFWLNVKKKKHLENEPYARTTYQTYKDSDIFYADMPVDGEDKSFVGKVIKRENDIPVSIRFDSVDMTLSKENCDF